MNTLEYVVLGAATYKLLSRKELSATVQVSGLNVTVSGHAPQPLTVSLYAAGDALRDSEEISGNYSATLTTTTIGPHTVKFTDGTNNTVRTITITVEDDVTPVFDIARMVGSNYLDPVLRRKEKEASKPFNPSYVAAELAARKAKGQNFLRVVVYWESMYPYAQNRENVLKQLEEIAKVAQEKGLKIVIDHHHFHGSSSWKFLSDTGSTRAGGGFPSYIVQAYPTNQPYQTSTYIYSTVKQFFQDWYSNTVQGFSNVWQEFFEQFWKPIIERIDKYDSVLGYEIMNELQYFDEPQLQLAGVFHTTIGGNMRALSDRYVIWDEGNVRGNQIDGAFARANQHLAGPQIANTIYAPHTYGVGTKLDTHIEDFKKTQAHRGGEPIFIGEHAAQDNNLSFANIKYQLQSFKNAGFGSTFWADASSETLGPGNNLRMDANNPNTGTWYYQARKEVYGY